MVRTACVVLVAVVAVSILGGCSKKDEAAPTGAATTTTTAGGKPAAKNAVNWEKVERVPFAKLQSLLPDTVLGMKRGDLRGATHPDGERTYSEAAADYNGPNESHLTITIQDHPVQAVEFISSKTTSFKGFPVFGESESSDNADLKFIVGDRFIVEAHGDKLKVAQLKTAFDKVDTTKLATWKSEGVK